MLCDLDHFKAVNDKHGHATGDYVLRRVVSACKPYLRPNDVFGRFGGEEFGFLFPACEPARSTPPVGGDAQGDREHHDTEQDAVEMTVSASFGIASTRASGFQLRQLLAHADAALYEAKRAGRNRVVVHERATAGIRSTAENAASTCPRASESRAHRPDELGASSGARESARRSGAAPGCQF